MSNRTALVALDDRLLCPGYRHDFAYGERAEDVGNTAWHIPFMWLALFREDDLIEEEVPLDPPANVLAPMAERPKALAQLKESKSALVQAYPEAPHLRDYVDLMVREVAQFQRRYFTIDLIEIEQLWPPDQFRLLLRLCLRGFADAEASETLIQPRRLLGLVPLPSRKIHYRWRDSLTMISGINPELPFPPADILLGQRDYPEDKAYNFYRLMPGAELRKSVWVK